MINAFYKKYQKHFDVSENNFAHFVMWSCGGICIGFVIGLVGIAFHLALEWATEFRTAHPMLLWLLPFGGLAIVLAYRLAGQEKDRGTNFILVAVRANEAVTLRTAPLIFFSTVVTHLLGGSAGREGAALQLGGSIASSFGRIFQLNEREGRIMTMCGMAAGFAALFGTPLTSVIFAMEVITVGVMHYSAIVPCIISALVGGRSFAGCRDCADYLFHRVYSCNGGLGKLLSGGGAWRTLRGAECAVLHCDGACRGCISQDIQKSLCACVLRRLYRHCGDLSGRVQGLQRRRHEYHRTGIAGGCEGGGIPAQDSFYRADLRRRL